MVVVEQYWLVVNIQLTKYNKDNTKPETVEHLEKVKKSIFEAIADLKNTKKQLEEKLKDGEMGTT